MKPIPVDFYARDTAVVARELLGQLMVRSISEGDIVGRIVETEAYYGADDPASHAARGSTPRSSIMFGPPGKAYVYFSYGMHHLLNAVTEEEGTAGAVLIRALEPIKGLSLMNSMRPGKQVTDLASGPAKLTQALGIDLSLNGADLTGPEILICEGGEVIDIVASPRIGISAGKDMLLRFKVSDNRYVSR